MQAKKDLKSQMMEKTLPLKHQALFSEGFKLHSKYGTILKSKTRAHLLGQLHNIQHFKNRKADTEDKIIFPNYDQNGKKKKYGHHDVSTDRIFVPVQVDGRLTSASGSRLVSAADFSKIVQAVGKSAFGETISNNTKSEM